MELLRDYNMTIFFHLGKSNMVVDSLTQKVVSMGNLVILVDEGRPLLMDIQWLDNSFIWLDISDLDCNFTIIEA